jgi:hypothetical protein
MPWKRRAGFERAGNSPFPESGRPTAVLVSEAWSVLCATRVRLRQFGAGLGMLLCACTGQVEQGGPGAGAEGPGRGPGGGSSRGPGDPAGDPGGGGGPALPTPDEFSPVPATLRRLTAAQYTNSLHALLGDDIQLPEALEADSVAHGLTSIGASRIALSPRITEQFETLALDAAHQALSQPDKRAALVPCTPEGEVDAACAEAFVAQLGRRAWRRPLSDAEVMRYAAVGSDASRVLGDFYAGLEYSLAGLLQSPHFLYRVEIGVEDPREPSRRVLDPYELATRLAFFAWNRPPDDALLDAAASGALDTVDGLRREALRLLSSPLAHGALSAFFTELLGLARLDDLPQLPSVFPQKTPTLGPNMREETLRTIEDLVFEEDGDYRDLFTRRTTFVNAELASLYALEASIDAGFMRVELPDDGPRAGLLGHGSLLALHAHPGSGSPTLRGKFVRETLLCQAIPPPPPDVVTSLPEDTGSGPRTTREKLEFHRTERACAACHSLMDPIGLGLENFDGIGAYRTTEVGKTIDASGELDGVDFDDARGLAQAVRDHEQLGPCLVRSLYRQALGHVETRGETSMIRSLAAQFADDGHRVQQLVLALVLSPAFRLVGHPE